jgi:hypothetical protein
MFIAYPALLQSTLPASTPADGSRSSNKQTPTTETIPNPVLAPNYLPAHQSSLSPLLARSTGVWFLLSGLIRLGAFLTWGKVESGFRGWYDAALLSLVVPLWHYGIERVVWGTVSNRQLMLAYGIDGVGSLWMWWVRGEVMGLR